MKKIVLAGNPNVGKSLLFSRITRIGMVTANYAGTTVETKVGKLLYKGNEYEILDGPGVYSLEEFSKTDQIALQLIEDADIIINVVDATNLERNLNLTLQLLMMGKPMIICLNFWDDTLHKGITIDPNKLEEHLKVPVVTVSALRGEGISELLASIENAQTGRLEMEIQEQWNYIGNIIRDVQRLQHRHHTLLEYIGDFTLHPIGGVISAIFVLIATLFIVGYMGEGLIRFIFEPFYTKIYNPLIREIVNKVPYDMVKGLLLGYSADPLQSFGILTSGIYIALVQVFPYFFSFYFV
ncbi:MAG TPA: FeoB small GTPase domain-containing protein, partial [Bacillota bacterium]|nr:FeoB small GTPase domain-containing protein [Bacillota bacterium]